MIKAFCFDMDGVLFDSAVTQIVYYPASKTCNYTIPNTIEVIGGNVFNGKSLEDRFFDVYSEYCEREGKEI